MEWPDPALKVRDRARFAHSTACSPRLSDDACRVPAELGARGATAPAREGAGAAAAGGRTACRPAQQRPTQRPPAQQPEQPVRALRGEYCRPAALRRPGGSTRWTLRAVRAPRRARRAPARLPVGGGAIWPIVQPLGGGRGWLAVLYAAEGGATGVLSGRGGRKRGSPIRSNNEVIHLIQGCHCALLQKLCKMPKSQTLDP